MADESQPDIEEERQRRYELARRSAEQLAAQQRIDAAGAMPAGSPTQFLGRESQLLGPRATDEFNIPLPTPRGAVGLRGYPGQSELPGGAQNAAREAFNASQPPYGASRISGQVGVPGYYPGTHYFQAPETNPDVAAVAQRYPSAPRFEMPSTDQLIDAGIQAKRNALQNEINTRKVHLGILPPSAIGASATTLASDQPVVIGGNTHHPRYAPSQAQQTRAELAILEHSAANLDRAQAGVIRQNSALALHNAKENEALAQDTARGQVVDFLSNLDDTRYPHGSEDRQKFIGKVFGSRPDWLHVMAKDKDLSKFVQDHVEAQDKVASTIAQLKTLYPDLEVTPKSITSKGALTYKVGESAEDKAASKEQSKLEQRLRAQTGLSPEEFAAIAEDSVKAGGIFVAQGKPGEGTFHHQGGGFNTTGTPKGEFSDDFTKVVEGYKPGAKLTPEQKKAAREKIAASGAIQIDTGRGYKSVIPRTDYERYRAAFAQDQQTSEAPTKGKRVMSVDDWLNQ